MIRLRHFPYGKEHPVKEWWSPARAKGSMRDAPIPTPVKRWLSMLYSPKCDAAVCAYEGDELVGFVRYDPGNVVGKRRKLVVTSGVWVAKSHRRKGLAKRMIAYMKRVVRPIEIHMTPISRAGTGLATMVQRSSKARVKLW